MTAACAPHLAREIDALRREGVDLECIDIGGQAYALVRNVRTPAPPWGRAAHDILIALPLADTGALDAFYLELPYTYRGQAHPRVSGQEVVYDGRSWKLVSSHYRPGQEWKPGRDSLEGHIEHCRGFFLERSFSE